MCRSYFLLSAVPLGLTTPDLCVWKWCLFVVVVCLPCGLGLGRDIVFVLWLAFVLWRTYFGVLLFCDCNYL